MDSNKIALVILSGLLAVFSGYYMIFITHTETFALYMLFGSVFLMVGFLDKSHLKRFNKLTGSRLQYFVLFVLGCLAGLMHLTRADGIIWLFGALIVSCWRCWGSYRVNHQDDKLNMVFKSRFVFQLIKYGLAVVVGYLIIMSPWYYRNVHLFGGLFPDGGSRTLWLLDYDQTFIYPRENLNINAWLDAGWGHHLRARVDALRLNLMTFLGVQTEVMLLPLIMLGLWRFRRCPMVRFALLMWLLTLFLMTIIKLLLIIYTINTIRDNTMDKIIFIQLPTTRGQRRKTALNLPS